MNPKNILSSISDTGKTILSKAAPVAKKAGSKVSDAALTVTAYSQRIFDTARDTAFAMTHGYSRYAAWNFGHFLLTRSANICGYLCEQSYEDIDMEYYRHLRECEDVFRAYLEYDNMQLSLFDKEFTTQKQLNESYTTASKRFRKAWKWYGENIMSPSNFVMPSTTKPTNIVDKVGCGTSNLLVRSRNGFTSIDMKNTFCADEAKLYSELIYKYVRDIHSYQDSYASSDRQLKKRDDDWASHQSLAVNLWVREGLKESYAKRENGYIRPKTREEIGIDFCAWVEDLVYAAEVLDLYSEWESPIDSPNEYEHDLSLREYMEVLDPKTADEITSGINAEFMKVWKWFGKNINELWD